MTNTKIIPNEFIAEMLEDANIYNFEHIYCRATSKIYEFRKLNKIDDEEEAWINDCLDDWYNSFKRTLKIIDEIKDK